MFVLTSFKGSKLFPFALVVTHLPLISFGRTEVFILAEH